MKKIRIRWKDINLDHPTNEMEFIEYDSRNSIKVRFRSGVTGSVLERDVYFPDGDKPKNYLSNAKYTEDEVLIFWRTQNEIENMQGGKLKRL